MSDTDRPAAPPHKSYFDRKPEEIPLHKLRLLIQQWVLPFNNLVQLCSTLGLNAVVAASVTGLADLLTPRLQLFPWLTAGALVLTVLCAVLQADLRPAWTARARRNTLGRLMLRPALGNLAALLLILSVTGAAWAQSHPGGRGLLAAQSPTLQSLQDGLLGLRADVAEVKTGVKAANDKLDRMHADQAAAQSEAASRQARAAARPDALGVLSLSLLPGAPSETASRRLHLAAYLNAPGLALKQSRLLLQTRHEASASWTSRDLSLELAASVEQQTLQFNLPNTVRELRLCLSAAYPDAAHPHAVRATYRLDAARGDQALQPAGAAELLSADTGPCGP